MASIKNLETRCIKSGYDKEIVYGILSQAKNLERSLMPRNRTITCKDKILVDMGSFDKEQWLNLQRILMIF